MPGEEGMSAEALENLIRLLNLHQPADEKEAEDVMLIRQMALANPAIYRRDSFPGHITGSALVVDRRGGRVLLHFHKSLDRWLQLGGHAEAGETVPSEIAMREAREESGLTDLAFFPDGVAPRPIDIDIHPIPAQNGQPDHLHLDIRYLLVTEQLEQATAADGESDRFLWLGLAELANIKDEVDPSLWRFLRKVRAVYQHSIPSEPRADSQAE
jgi:8-oxo-dGTP pyrophosphatase MutT (NUDIX family)